MVCPANGRVSSLITVGGPEVGLVEVRPPEMEQLTRAGFLEKVRVRVRLT